ncbi:MAG: hypothetical protein ACYC0B_05740 [Gemmatimonadaceae bacterium]
MATATRAAATPATGLWTEEQLLDRLVRAGVAPRRAENPRRLAAWMNRDPVVLLAGGGEVHAWIYPDSVARLAVTAKLDSESATPRGETIPFTPPMRFVVQSNLAAVVSGGSERNLERVALALQAGLPVAQERAPAMLPASPAKVP